MAKRNPYHIFLLFLLILNPILDLITGTAIYMSNPGGIISRFVVDYESPLLFSATIRYLLLIVSIAVLLFKRNRMALLCLLSVLAALLLSVLGEATSGLNYSFGLDLMYILDYSYGLLIPVIICAAVSTSGQALPLNQYAIVLCADLLFVSAGVIIPYLFGIGFFTYAGVYSRGCIGLFFFGNDLANLLLILFPCIGGIYIFQPLSSAKSVLYLIAASISTTAMLLIGTKTSIWGLGLTVLCFFIAALSELVRSSSSLQLKRFFNFLILSIAIFALISLLSGYRLTDSVFNSLFLPLIYLQNDGYGRFVFSGRLGKLTLAWKQFISALPRSLLTGIGSGTQEKVIEMDGAELLLYYGIPGVILLLWPYAVLLKRIAKQVRNRSSVAMLPFAWVILLTAAVSQIVGHVLFSTTVNIFYALLLCFTIEYCCCSGKTANSNS